MEACQPGHGRDVQAERRGTTVAVVLNNALHRVHTTET